MRSTVKYKEESVFAPCQLRKHDYLELEEIIFNDIPEAFVSIYDICAGGQNFDTDPEYSMEDFIENDEIFDYVKQNDDFYITVNYLDKNHQLYLRFSGSNTILLVKGIDDQWVSSKINAISDFLISEKPELTEEDEKLALDTSKGVKAKERRVDEVENVKSGCIAGLILLLCIAIVIAALCFFFYRYY